MNDNEIIGTFEKIAKEQNSNFLKTVLDIINRQKAEIEMLKDVTTNTINTSIEFGLDKEKQINKAKSEAIKEYKEKVKSILMSKGLYLVVVKNALNEAEKKMTEGREKCQNM